MPDFSTQLTNEQRQIQQLSLRKLQGLELLHLPQLALEERLRQELERNPMLEEELPEEPVADLPPDSAASGSDADEDDEATLDERIADLDEWNDELPLPEPAAASAGTEKLPDYWLNSPAPMPSLRDQLNEEVGAAGLPRRLAELAEKIIDELDDSGYLTTPLADLAMSCDADLEELEAALHYVQSLDPAGVGARSLGECLRLQLERSGRLTPLLAAVLDNGLDDVARNRLPALAHRLKVPLDELKAALEELRRLDPAPGRRLTTTTAECIRPEVEIRRGDHGFEAVPLDDRERRLIINPVYRELLDTADLAAADRSYLREKLQRAREFIQALEQRRSTILRLAEVIASEQGPFMEHGVEALRPMTMKQAAARLGVHETTVSRAAAEKYILTPQGIFPFKFFFSGKVAAAGTDAGELSNRAVMERIRELIAAEDPKHPLSDEKIAAALTAGGVAIARRTVAKYRESMKIPPTNLRRRH